MAHKFDFAMLLHSKNPDGSVCYIIGIKKEIREQIGKPPGDTVHVVIWEREA